jgi:hypothetical protein
MSADCRPPPPPFHVYTRLGRKELVTSKYVFKESNLIPADIPIMRINRNWSVFDVDLKGPIILDHEHFYNNSK